MNSTTIVIALLVLIAFLSIIIVSQAYSLGRAKNALKHIQASVPYVKFLAIELARTDGLRWRSYNDLDSLLFNIESIQRSTDSIVGVQTPNSYTDELFRPRPSLKKTPEASEDGEPFVDNMDSSTL